MHHSLRIQPRWLGLAAVSLALAAGAETIRVTTWNFAPTDDSALSNRVDLVAVANTLRRLDPDVILLQNIRGWGTCAQLVQALKPLSFTIVSCSAFGNTSTASPETHPATNFDELLLSYQSQIAQTKTELATAQKQLAQSRTALGAIGEELSAQGLTDWNEVTPEQAEAYWQTAVQIQTLSDQEHDLRHRGYKEGHPLVQSVRSQLRNISARRAELEHESPVLKYIVADTNAPNWTLAAQLKENKSLNGRVAQFQGTISMVEAQLSNLREQQTKQSRTEETSQPGAQTPQPSQVAILAKQKAYFSWSAQWTASNPAAAGGFAFGAIQTPKQRLGFFSIDFHDDLEATGAVQQLLGELRSIRKWEQNQVETFILACSFDKTEVGTAEQRSQVVHALQQAGFSGDLAGNEGEPGRVRRETQSQEGLFAESTALAFKPQPDVGATGPHVPLTWDLELDPAKVAAGRLARVEAQTLASGREFNTSALLRAGGAILAVGTAFFLGLAWMIRRQGNWRFRKSTRLLPVRAQRGAIAPSSYTVIVAPTSITGSLPDPAALPPVVPTVHVETARPGPTQSAAWERRALAAEHRAQHAEALVREGLLPHLSRWMREKLLRKLLVDRSRLLAAQDEATRKVMAVDARLTKLEAEIQQQTRLYVKRIEELTAELLAAKEENRELIRAKITQVKTEMEAARKRLRDQQTKAAKS